jgi:alpha-1,2-mannosyltransferase
MEPAALRRTEHRPIMGARGRWAMPTGVGLAALGAIFLAAALLIFHESRGWGYDFEAYYLAAQRWARGDGLYQSWQLTEPFRPGPFGLYLYAPPLALAVVPFTLLTVQNATVAWVVLRLVLLAGACALMPVRTPLRLAAFGVAAFSKPVLTDLDLGNVSIIVTFLCVVAWRWLDRPLGSIALALAMSIRPTLGVLLGWWLLRRRWLPIVWTLAAGLVLIGVTLPFVGIEGYRDFLQVLGNVTQVTGVTNNLDLGSTALRLGLGPLGATLALYAGYAVAAAAILASMRRDRELSFIVTVGASLLLAPLLWDHYLVGLLLPAAFLAARGRSWGMALPLLAWAPAEMTGLVVMAGVWLPFLAPRRPDVPVATDRSPAPSMTIEPAVGY